MSLFNRTKNRHSRGFIREHRVIFFPIFPTNFSKFICTIVIDVLFIMNIVFDNLENFPIFVHFIYTKILFH